MQDMHACMHLFLFFIEDDVKNAHRRKFQHRINICAVGRTGNAFRDALRRIAAEHEFQVIVRGLVILLNNPHQANNTLLPSSMKQIACFQEVRVT